MIFIVADAYGKAKDVARKLEDTSNLDSESENKPRKRNRPKKLYETGSDDSESEKKARFMKGRRQGKKKSLNVTGKSSIVFTKEISDDDGDNYYINNDNNNGSDYDDLDYYFKTSTSAKTNANGVVQTELVQPIDISATVIAETPPTAEVNISPVRSPLQAVPEENYKELLNNITKTQNEHSHLLQEILSVIKTSNCNIEKPKNFPILPLHNTEVYEEWETYISDKSNFNAACAYLAYIGGYKMDETVRNVMKTLFSYDLAKKFNWKGSGGKRAFRESLTKDVVFSVTRKNFVGARLVEVYDIIKSWLKHAPARVKPSKKTASKSIEGNPQ